MALVSKQPKVGQAAMPTPEDFDTDAVLQAGGFDLEGLNEVDFSQYLNDFDDNGEPLNEPNADSLLQDTHVSPAAVPETGDEDRSSPANIAATKDSAAAVATTEGFIAPTLEPIAEYTTSHGRATEGEFSINTNDIRPDYQSPPLEDTPLFPGPMPVDWSLETGMQPRYSTFRPVSAPLRSTYNVYDRFLQEQQYDQTLDFPEWAYPSPSSGMHNQSGGRYTSNTLRTYGAPVANKSPMASYPYQQTSISYPGSPTQPIDPALAMNGYLGLPGVRRQVHQYQPLPHPNNYDAAAMFGYGRSGAFNPSMRIPPTSNPLKHAAPTSDDGESPGPKRQRIHDWLAGTNAASPFNSPLQPLRTSNSARAAANQHARSVIASIDSFNSEVDLTKAVKLATRRNRNPGRKNVIPQTPSVLRRNRIRRERYRDSLTPQKRKEYDFNASVAKGLITMPGAEEAEDDEIHDAVFEKLSGDDIFQDGDDDER